MAAEQTRLAYLFDRYINRLCTEVERKEFFDQVVQNRNKTLLQGLIDRVEEETLTDVSEEKAGLMYERIWEELGSRPAKHIRLFTWKKIAVAASIILVVSTLALVGVFTKKQGSHPAIVQTIRDIEAPKATRAVITLADGSEVYLDGVNNGTIAQQNNVSVVKNTNGEISYQQAAQGRQPVAFNTLYNPRGSKVISLTLTDGTRVWLNAASSLKYPTAFNGTTREVEVTGEAYFEVAHDASKPFHVKKGEMDVTVLGTHFNVNAYEDEKAIWVTLLEGSVEVKSQSRTSGTKVKIRPGEQAILSQKSSPSTQIQVQTPDLDAVMAWKNGLFQMNNADIATIMRQISRWYDMEVVYEKGIPEGHITGKVPRNTNLSNVLKVLEYSGLRFEVEGKKITVK